MFIVFTWGLDLMLIWMFDYFRFDLLFYWFVCKVGFSLDLVVCLWLDC